MRKSPVIICDKCGKEMLFYGTIDEFRDTREGKVAKEYLMIGDLIEYHFSESEETE